MKIVKEFTFKYNIENLPKLVQDLYALKNECKVYTFTGPLGAGKTTLVKALLKKFGVHEAVTSPTFNYVNIYKNDKDELLYHFDIYRLASLDEFLELGFDEFLYLPHSWAFIEWPELIEPLLEHSVCQISIDYDHDDLNQRVVTYKVIE